MQNPLQAINDSIHTISVEQPKRYPLSAAQQALWYLHQQSTIGTAYHTAFAASIHSKVDVTSLQQASQTLFERHNSLRSTIILVGDKPCHAVHDDCAVDFAHVLCPPTESESAWRQRVQCAYAHPFDLEQGPLFRVRLLTRTDTEHVLLISAHHLIIDGLSMRVLLEELALLYAGLLRSMPPQLPTLRATYQDFVTWERETLQQQEEALWQYWQEQLSDVETLQLPLDRPRPALQSYRGASFYFQVPAELLQKLEALNGVATATLHSKLLTAFQILLYRYSGQNCFAVGIPGSNRLRPEFQRLVGYLTNLLPIRTEIAADASFYQMLQETTRRTFAATMRQTLPFSHIVARLNPTRDLSCAPITQVIFGFLPSPKGLSGYYITPPDPVDRHLTAWSEFHLSPFSLPQQEGQFDLALEVEEEAGRLLGRFKYNSDLFDEATIARLAGHFAMLLQGIVAQPEQPVLQLPMLTVAEYQQVVHEWNDTTVDFGPPQTIHALFEQQVERIPDAIALVFEAEQLTYAELNARANQLAHYLIDLGVKPDTLVAVMMERSIEMVVSLLAVLKAGGAYVPIDPTYPPERIAFMLQDCAAPILLTQSHLDFVQTMEEEVGEGRRQIIAVDQVGRQLATYPTGNPQTPTTPEHLAYVIYTSGSTGQPKGSLISHRNVWRLFAATNGWFKFTNTDVWTLFHSVAFDFSVWELWGALFYGGRLVVVPYFVSRDPQAFYQLLCDQGVTVLNQTPSAFRQLIAVVAQALPAHTLRYVIFGGEALEFESLRPWFTQHGDGKPQLVNMYGITETTVHVTYQPIQASDLDVRRGSSRIGQAIPDLCLYILDEYQTPVPVGIAAELYVGGAGLVRGYLNRPELTAERFIEHPAFGRLYKTGDLCRWLPDGNIEYIGRTDFQVKIRGFRIELGEIESLLLAQEEVREAVVVAREERAGDKRLVAYVVLRDAGNASPIPALRSALQAKLPEYMMPSAFVFLKAMPLTPNGKLDRKALPAPEYGEAQDEFVAPRTALEAQLAAIWQAVLGVERVGVHDNFFALGGHSLLATQVISRIRTQLKCEVPLKWLFEAPQIAAFAQRLSEQEASLRSHNRPLVPALVRSGELPYRFPLSFAQQRLWFLDQLETNSGFYNIPMQLHLTGALDIAALAASFHYLQARHESLRTRFATVDGEAVQVIDSPSPITLAVQPVDSEAAADALARQEAILPFNLQRGPLWRVQLLQVAEREHRLLLTLHHSISDGWSSGVLVKELSQAYRSYLLGEPPSLPALPIQYADFAVWQRAYLTGETLHRHLGYWQAQLRDAPALLELPTDRPRPPVQSHRGARHAFQLSAERTRQLHQLAQAHDATLFMVLLAAFNVLLARYSRQTDLVVGSPIANRNQAEIEGLIGFFVNTLVLRTQLDDNPSFHVLLERVRQTTLAAYEHQDLPFEQLVEALQPERSLSYSPLFQVMFVLQNAERGEWSLPNLTARMAFADFPFAKFDLTLNLVESDAGLLGMLEYNSDLFDESTIVRMAGHFEVLLQGIVNQPAQPVLHLPMLTEAEYQQIVYDWNDTAVDFGPAQTIHALFEQQVARTPDAVAVIMAESNYELRITMTARQTISP